MQRIHVDTLTTPPGYSHGILTAPGALLFVAGQVPLDDGGDLVGRGDFREQAHQVFRNLGIVLKAGGAGYYDIAKMTVFMLDIQRDLACFREVRSQYVNSRCLPASSAVEVRNLFREGVLLEVECVAQLPAAGI
jgi:enamine deaminase RidA (YjgF/YER057c/UK114 family)